MQPWIVLVVMVAAAVLFWVAHHFGWIDLSNKAKSSGSGGIAGIGDEVFHPTRHEAQVEMDRQTVLPAPAPLPGDGDLGIGDFGKSELGEVKSYDGRVRIDLDEDRTGQRSAGE